MKKKAPIRRRRKRANPAAPVVETQICRLCGCPVPIVPDHDGPKVHADWHEFVASIAKNLARVTGDLSKSIETALQLSRSVQ